MQYIIASFMNLPGPAMFHSSVYVIPLASKSALFIIHGLVQCYCLCEVFFF